MPQISISWGYIILLNRGGKTQGIGSCACMPMTPIQLQQVCCVQGIKPSFFWFGYISNWGRINKSWYVGISANYWGRKWSWQMVMPRLHLYVAVPCSTFLKFTAKIRNLVPNQSCLDAYHTSPKSSRLPKQLILPSGNFRLAVENYGQFEWLIHKPW